MESSGCKQCLGNYKRYVFIQNENRNQGKVLFKSSMCLLVSLNLYFSIYDREMCTEISPYNSKFICFPCGLLSFSLNVLLGDCHLSCVL